MRDIDEDWIRNRAYMLWERAGRQHGQDRQHWLDACRDYAEMADAADAVIEKSRKRVRSAGDGATLAEGAR